MFTQSSDFLTYKDLILSPPLPAIIAILIVLGFRQIAVILSNKIIGKEYKTIEISAFYIVVLAFSASLIHISTSLLGVSWQILRIGGWILCLLGIYDLYQLLINFKSKRNYYFTSIKIERKISKIQIYILLSTLILLGLSVLGPPTDADSLGYHIGIPLDILRKGQILPNPYWMEYRIIGLGEILNMFGLAAGTDSLGAVLQFSGVIILLNSLLGLIKKKENKILFSASILGCPILLFLVPNQKPELLPAVAIVLALVMIVYNRTKYNKVHLFLIMSLIFFAMANKYLFYIPGFVLFVLLLIFSIKSKIFGKSIIIFFCLFLIILFPFLLQRFIFYGDPLSPLFEKYIHPEMTYLMGFSKNLSDWKPFRNIFPTNLIFPGSFSEISTNLGLFSLIFLLFKPNIGNNKKIIYFTAFAIGLLYFLSGARVARYYLGPYILIAFSVISVRENFLKRIFSKAIFLQSIFVFLAVVYMTILLLPGAITSKSREHVFNNQADNYNIMHWADEVLPKDKKIISMLRSFYFYPRPFLPRDFIRFADLSDKLQKDRIREALLSNGVHIGIANYPLTEDWIVDLGLTDIKIIAGPKQFVRGMRNPFNKAQVNICIFKFNVNPDE